MFFSPGIAITVALGTTFGFFLTTPVIIALRALSHLIFAVIGSYFAKETRNRFKNGQFTLANWRFQSFNFVIGIIHSIAEMLVVSVFFFVGTCQKLIILKAIFIQSLS